MFRAIANRFESDQVTSACISPQQVGVSGGMTSHRNFLEFRGYEITSDHFGAKNNASQRPDDRVLHA